MLCGRLEYAAAGLPVFPCGLDKRPLITAWPTEASTDPTQLREWWSRLAGRNDRAPDRRRSGLYVVDIDVRRRKSTA